MYRPRLVLPGILLGFVLAGLLALHACQEPTYISNPDFAVSKSDRTLTVTGGGTGAGAIILPAGGEAQPMECDIQAGVITPSPCSRVYPWKASVTLTATPAAGSSFSGWSGACSGTGACKLKMTQARSVKASFSGTGVASFTLSVAGGGTGDGTVNSQTGLSPAINCTITAGTRSGACSGSYPNQTSVILTAAAASGSTFGSWSGACSANPCTLAMTADRSATATFTAPLSNEALVGKWDAPQTTPVIALHVTHLMNGKFLLWGHGGEPYTWDPSTNAFTMVPDNTCTNPSACELFCSGHTFLADGRLLVAGGHDEALGDQNGLTQSSIFNGTSWSGSGSMAYRRWYPTLIELEDGKVVAISGNVQPDSLAPFPERYDPASGQWTVLSGANLKLAFYPRAFLEPKNGWIFFAGEEQTSRYLIPTGSGSWTTSGLGNGGNRVVADRNYGAAVMLDSKVLYVAGGGNGCPTTPQNTAEIIDLGAAIPTWTATGSLKFGRRHLNATILPDGSVLATGGTSACGGTDESGAVFAAEHWDPATGQWSQWANASVVRVYHSTAVLLSDGRVMESGSGDGGVTQQFTYELFSPPYLFKGARPTYTLPGGSSIHFGTPFSVASSDASSITKVTLIRLAATTHAFDEGQRLNTLVFQAAVDGQSLTVTPPTSARLAPPGPYMLFILNDQGVPSVARTVLLN